MKWEMDDVNRRTSSWNVKRDLEPTYEDHRVISIHSRSLIMQQGDKDA